MSILAIYPTPLDANCELLCDNNEKFIGIPEVYNNRQGVGFNLTSTIPNGNGAQLTVSKIGYNTLVQRGILYLSPTVYYTADDFHLVPVASNTQGLNRLTKNGWDLINGSQRYIQKHITNFLDFQRFMETGQVRDYAHFDGYRVTSLMQTVPNQAGLKDLRPENYPNYYQKLEDYFKIREDKEYRVELTICCDTEQMGMSSSYLYDHAMRVLEVWTRHDHNLLEGINEIGHGGNTTDVNIFRDYPANVPFCIGSSVSGGPCPLSARFYSAIHGTRSPIEHVYTDSVPAEMIIGYTGYAGTQGPCTYNEMIGADEIDQPGKRSTDRELFRRVAGSYRAYNGGTLHAQAAIFSLPLGPIQQNCADGFLEGIS